MKPVLERFLEKISVSNTNFYKGTACWEWTAYKDKFGYGRFQLDRKPYRAHRLSYEYFKGEIPKGLELDHLCRNRKCVNPDHLEAVTQRENKRRSLPGLRKILKIHCPQGHPYSGKNIMIRKNGRGRNCRICHRISNLQYYQRKKCK